LVVEIEMYDTKIVDYHEWYFNFRYDL